MYFQFEPAAFNPKIPACSKNLSNISSPPIRWTTDK